MVLLIIIFISFIGMGIPHSLLGVAWPEIYGDIGADNSAVSILMIIISGCTVISSLCNGRLLKRFGESRMAIVCMTMTSVSILLISFSRTFTTFCIVAAVLGLGAGAIETALNNYVVEHYSAAYMNFLHCFYAIGITASPFILTLTLERSTWRTGYRIVFLIQFVIACILFASRSLWKAAPRSIEAVTNADTLQGTTETVSHRFPLRAVAALVIIFTANVIEYTCGSWGSTYLVEVKAFSSELAASVITVYCIGMIIGRLFGSIFAIRCSCWKLVAACAIIQLAGILSLLFPIPLWLIYISFFLIGFGNGPMCPNVIYLMPNLFGGKMDQSVIGIEIASGYAGVLLTPIFFGLLTRIGALHCYPPFMFIIAVLMLIGSAVFVGIKRRNSRLHS